MVQPETNYSDTCHSPLSNEKHVTNESSVVSHNSVIYTASVFIKILKILLISSVETCSRTCSVTAVNAETILLILLPSLIWRVVISFFPKMCLPDLRGKTIFKNSI